MANPRLIRVFVSCPSDVQAVLKVLLEVAQQINETQDRARLELWDWSRGTPQIGPTPQDVVDPQIPEHDVYLGIMSGRFGTPTGQWRSGTEKEFRDALQQWKAKGTPWILFYFNEKPKCGTSPQDAQQLAKVRRFRDELQKLGITGTYAGLTRGPRALQRQVDRHLRDVIRHVTESAATKQRKPVKAVFPAPYRKWLLQQNGKIELLGLKRGKAQSVQLSSVYVPLTTAGGVEQGFPEKKASALARQYNKPALLLNSLGDRSIHVPGAPGSGKSTFCRWVAWLVASGEVPRHAVPHAKGFRGACAGCAPELFAGSYSIAGFLAASSTRGRKAGSFRCGTAAVDRRLGSKDEA